MKVIKISLICCVLISIASCASKKSISEKVVSSKSDTLILKTSVIEQPPILSSLTINEICDSITGKPKNFKQIFVVGGDTLELSIKNNELNLNINRLKKELEKKDSIIAIRDSQYSEVNEKEVIRNVIPFKYWVWLLVSIAVNLVLAYFLFRGRTKLF